MIRIPCTGRTRLYRWNSLLVFGLLAACAPQDPEAVLAEARMHYEDGDSRTALILVQNLLQKDAEFAPARVLLGRLAFEAGDFELARLQLENARGLGAPAIQFAVPLANTLIAHNEAALALETLSLLGESERTAEYWVAVSNASVLSGDLDGASLALNQAATIDGDPVEQLVARARIAIARGNMRAAESYLTEALEADDRAAAAFELRGVLPTDAFGLEARAADLRAAADIYESLGQPLRAAPNRLRLVQIELARNDIDRAAEAALQLTALFPDSPYSDYAGGLVAFQQGDFERTVDLLRIALTKAPDQPEFMALLGAAHMAVGSLGQAEQQLLSVLSLRPDDPAALRLLAEARVRQERPSAALQALSALEATAFESDTGLLLLQSIALLQNGDPAGAIPFLEQAAELNPADQAVVLQLARAYAETGQANEAFSALASSPALTLDEAYTANVLVLLDRLQNGGIEQATEYVESLVANRPDDAAPHLLAAIASQYANDVDAVLASLDRALAVDASFIPARIAKARVLIDSGQTAEAEVELGEVIRIDAANLAALLSLAQISVDRNDLSAAVAYLERAAAGNETATPRLALARLYVIGGDFESAAVQVGLARDLDASDPELAAVEGMIALAEGDAQLAAARLQIAFAAAPNRPSTVLLLAQALTADGDLDAARDLLIEAAARMPAVMELKAALGGVALLRGDRDESLRIARDIQVAYGQRSAGFALEAQLMINERRYEDAARLYAMAYARDPGWETLARRVAALRLSGSADTGVGLVREWLAGSPGDINARLALGNLLSEQNDIDAALDEFVHVIELDPENLVALNNGAWYAFLLDRPESVDYAERAVRVAPNNGAVLDTFGWILTEQDRATEGLIYLERATQSAPDDPEIRYHLAVAQAQSGRRDAARATLEELLREAGPFGQREAAAALLETL